MQQPLNPVDAELHARKQKQLDAARRRLRSERSHWREWLSSLAISSLVVGLSHFWHELPPFAAVVLAGLLGQVILLSWQLYQAERKIDALVLLREADIQD